MPEAATTATETETETPPPGGGETKPEDLGDAGKKAIDEERKARRAAEKAAKDAQAELDKLRQESMSEQEKAIAQARAEAKTEVLKDANQRVLRSEIKAAAGGKLADPADAVGLLGDLDRFVGDDGEVDSKAISSAIDELIKSKPYLAANGSRPAPLPGGGATPPNGISIDDDIRRRAGRH